MLTVGRHADQPLHVTGDQIDFQIDRVAHAGGGEGGVGYRVGDQGDFKPSSSTSLTVRLTPSTQIEPFLAM